jgi:DHA2 family multidrug resistance protein
MRNLGGAIGLAAINTVLIDRFAMHEQRLADHITATRPVVQGFLDNLSARYETIVPVDPDLAALKTLHRLVEREALVLTFNDALLLMAGAFFLSLLLMPLIRKPKAVGEGGGGH